MKGIENTCTEHFNTAIIVICENLLRQFYLLQFDTLIEQYNVGLCSERGLENFWEIDELTR